MEPHDLRYRKRVAIGRALWLLTCLFALRVAGQAVQRWMPLPQLPAFQDFQGSRIDYPVLLCSQLLILACMAWCSHRCGRGAIKASPHARRALLWVGGLYMAGAVARVAIGLADPFAPAWFRAWIPGVFHGVLAGYLLVLAAYHQIMLRSDR